MADSKALPTGILGFPITPFKQNNLIDEQALETNIRFLLDEGLHAIFIGCGSGEFQSLSMEEYQSILELAVQTTNGRVPVFSGVGGNISQAVKQADISAKVGADGYLILPPYLIDGEQEGLYNYYKAIAERTNLAAVIYQRGNAIFSLQTLRRLIEIPQVKGFKDGYGNMEKNIEFIKTVGDRLEWFNGMPFAEVTMPAYWAMGYRSYSSAISNYIPHISRIFYAALLKQDEVMLDELYREAILPLNNIRKQRKGYAVSLIKAGMEIMGLSAGDTVRAPILPVEQEHYKQLEVVLNNVMSRFPVQVAAEG